MELPGKPSERSPENTARPAHAAAPPARRSRSVTRARPSGSSPRTRRSISIAPRSRASRMASRQATCHPIVTAGTTTFGLKHPNAAATTSPGTCPIQAHRLVK
jgi:hypothetical protein